MTELAFLALLIPLLAVGLLYMRRLGRDGAGTLWGLGWLCLWANGMVVAGVGDAAEGLRGVGNLLGSLFAALVLSGALVFTGRRAPPWIVGLGLLLGLVSGSLRAAGLGAAAFAISRLDVLFFAAASFVLWRSATQGLEPKRVLALLLSGIAVLHVGERALASWGVGGLELLVLWAGLSLGAGLAQVFCFLERRRLHEQDLRRSLEAERRTLEALVESIPAGLVLVGTDGRVALHNREAVTAAGLAPGTSLLGRCIEDLADGTAQLVSPRERDAAVAAVREIGWMPDTRREVEVRFPGPPERWLAISAREVEGREGDRLGRVWVLRDQTEAKRFAARLGRAQRMEALAGLVGGIAHDFNNQLTTILGNVALLLEALREGDPGWEELVAVQRAADHSAGLTRGLLDFSRQRVRPLRALSVEGELREVAALLRPELPAGVRLETEVARELPSLRADATQFRRVISNLVANAAAALGKTGCIRIEAEGLPVTGDGPEVILRVRDDGPGMDPATRERIFEPFFTTRSDSGGTGLGMAIVYGIARSYGARIEVESEPERGTCVSLTWPATEEPPSPAPTAFSRPADLVGEGRIVLLAEDDEAVRKMARRALNERGYRVIEARDGQAAIDLVRNRAQDVATAVLDLDMPGRSGIDTLRELRKLCPALPAVLATGWMTDEQRADLPDDVAVLDKPFAPDQLAQAVGASIPHAPPA